MTDQTYPQSNVAKLKTKPRKSESLWERAFRHILHDRLTMFALIILLVMTILVIFAPFITQNILQVSAIATKPSERLLPPGTLGHILGTDDLGRDHLARLLYGGQVSLGIGVAGAVLTLLIGVVIGLYTGFYGGFLDDAANWVIVTLDSLPTLYLLIIIAALFRPSAESLVLVLAFTGWTGVTRLIRGQTIALREFEYVLSARATGATPLHLMFTHLLPNQISVIAITLASGIGGLILTESALSFLNIGVQPPTPTWGNMLSNAQQFFVRGPHLVVIPGLLIFVTVLCLFIVGDGIRDAFDPATID